jgi:hypothetical protein
MNFYTASSSGVQPSSGAADTVNGNKFPPGDDVFIRFFNSDASPHNVTLHLPPPPDLADAVDRVITIPAGLIQAFGPFPAEAYAQPTGDPADVGFVWVTADFAMTCYAVRVPRR